MRRILAGILMCCSLAAPSVASAANTSGTDFSDMWWVPSESGWGANIANQGPLVFMTMYVYGANNTVKWYVAPRMEANISPILTGSLFETTGPVLGGAFDPSLVSYRHVGSATLDFTSPTAAFLGYTVDGVGASKAIQRYTFASNDLTGFYVGAAVSTDTTCVSAATKNVTFSIIQTGSALTISAQYATGLLCRTDATYTQAGRMGSYVGTQTCSDGVTYSFSAREIEASYQGFFGRYDTVGSNGCVQSGRFGGVKS